MTLDACAPHADQLGCRDELEGARKLSRHPGAERQRKRARKAAGLAGVVAALADAF
jgi:gamma-glutamyl:cysteine ligase YbdK (ATP-grasp superfamily)